MKTHYYFHFCLLLLFISCGKQSKYLYGNVQEIQAGMPKTDDGPNMLYKFSWRLKNPTKFIADSVTYPDQLMHPVNRIELGKQNKTKMKGDTLFLDVFLPKSQITKEGTVILYGHIENKKIILKPNQIDTISKIRLP